MTPEQVKKDRLAQVQNGSNNQSIDKTDAMLGKIQRVLIEKFLIKDPNVDWLAQRTILVWLHLSVMRHGLDVSQRLRSLKLKL